MIDNLHRREMLAATAGMLACAGSSLGQSRRQGRKHSPLPGENMRYGLVTYQWGKDWDLPTLIENCTRSICLGVELRTTHAHGVETTLNKDQRREVSKRFADSPVVLVGIGSNERFDNPDPAVVTQAIERSKEFVVLSHDVGGSGVKVKPDRFYDDVPREKTIEQIGRALNELGSFAASTSFYRGSLLFIWILWPLATWGDPQLDSAFPATGYALQDIQERGALFIGPKEEVYEGQIIGEGARVEMLNVSRTTVGGICAASWK